MVSSGSVRELFAELRQTESLEDVMSRGLQLVCEATGCAAAGVTGHVEQMPPNDWWMTYDPMSLLKGATLTAGEVAEGGDAPDSGADTGQAVTPADRGGGVVRVPLQCGFRCVGTLVLCAPKETGQARIESLLSPLDTVLATLMAAATGICADGVLTSQGFHERIVWEIARGKRYSEGFAVVHMRICAAGDDVPDGKPPPWAAAARIGAALRRRLRESDAIGLMATDRLAILLTATSPLGARIAQRRIMAFLASLDAPLPESKRSSLELAFHIKSFPGDGDHADALCRGEEWVRDDRVPGPSVGEAS